MATRARGLTAKGAATRSRIVDAAADLVFERGVAGTSLDQVLAASGTGRSQLYHYFADKDALIRAVISRQTERVLAAQDPYLRHLDSLDGLRRWCEAVVAVQRVRQGVGGCPVGSLASELSDASEPARVQLEHSFGRWEAYLCDGLHAMRERGELVADSDPAELAGAVLAALQGGLLLSQATRSTRHLELGLAMALSHVEGRQGDGHKVTRARSTSPAPTTQTPPAAP